MIGIVPDVMYDVWIQLPKHYSEINSLVARTRHIVLVTVVPHEWSSWWCGWWCSYGNHHGEKNVSGGGDKNTPLCSVQCAVCNITKLRLGRYSRVSPFVNFLKQHELLQSQLLQNRTPIRANSCRVSYEYRTLSNSPRAWIHVNENSNIFLYTLSDVIGLV